MMLPLARNTMFSVPSFLSKRLRGDRTNALPPSHGALQSTIFVNSFIHSFTISLAAFPGDLRFNATNSKKRHGATKRKVREDLIAKQMPSTTMVFPFV